jgi:hypothetical protein|uniref:Uncharacterized protein n=1 Tax=Phage sp. ctGns7 TaxID=2828003 RepID=A0A8S5S9S0_9VIRU|nr:MAG TPA: hypothetical protein [Phage sp. ctGns7]DAG72106.1 MAG TPA: hypothetical protein [Caudoviricetes sp.]DAN05863.1 MAG TPA: hypothetical protein [Caudoviricetes sp.]
MANNNVRQEISALDVVSVMGTMLGIMTYDKVITKDDLEKNMHNMLIDIHNHLEEQDKKLDLILNKIGGDVNG